MSTTVPAIGPSDSARLHIVRHFPNRPYPNGQRPMIRIQPPRLKRFRERSASSCHRLSTSPARFADPRAQHRWFRPLPGVLQLSPIHKSVIAIVAMAVGRRVTLSSRYAARGASVRHFAWTITSKHRILALEPVASLIIIAFISVPDRLLRHKRPAPQKASNHPQGVPDDELHMDQITNRLARRRGGFQ